MPVRTHSATGVAAVAGGDKVRSVVVEPIAINVIRLKVHAPGCLPASLGHFHVIGEVP